MLAVTHRADAGHQFGRYQLSLVEDAGYYSFNRYLTADGYIYIYIYIYTI